MNDTTLFAFEDDFVITLRCIPMAVRFKLDTCEVKVSLRQWSRLSQQDRRALLMRPCESAAETAFYKASLINLIAEQANGDAKPLPPGSTVSWAQAGGTPEAIRLFARSVGAEPPADGEWAALTPLQRFVLLKLSRDNHDNVNFVPALREFGLYHEPAHSAEISYAASA